MKFLRNIIRAIKYKRKKHVPVKEFIGGVEDRWSKTLDDLQDKEAFLYILDKFHESHPDAATIVGYAFKAFMKID